MSTTADPSQAALPAEESDIWWGGFSLWAILPGVVVCVAATALLAWLTWQCLPPGYGRIAFLGIGGALWLVQGFRWGLRVFGYNYRLTSHGLYCHRGFSPRAVRRMNLEAVSSVAVRETWLERLVGVGRVVVRSKENAKLSIVFQGVYNPTAIAGLIWAQVQPPAPP